MPDELMEKWLEYYDENGLTWLDTGVQAAIKQAFFAGANAVEQPLALDGANCPACQAKSVIVGTQCLVCGVFSPRK